MATKWYQRAIAIWVVLVFSITFTQAQTNTNSKGPGDANGPAKRSAIRPAAGGPSVKGTGTSGMIPKWIDSGTIGDSIITQNSGKVGIGTLSPTSKFTVQGMIETTLGGLKFPDGSVQTTSAAGALSFVSHDITLHGFGTSGSPLQITVPLSLAGSAADSSGQYIIDALNTDPSGVAGRFRGGNAVAVGNGNVGAGTGLLALGGNNTGPPNNASAGVAVQALGGHNENGAGGFGVYSQGGTSNTGGGGVGVYAQGGMSANGPFLGTGLYAQGAFALSTPATTGGVGVQANGGIAQSPGHTGGDGIVAIAGFGMAGATTGRAGAFFGDVEVSGNLSKGGGSFKIDHPLDPENKYLYHSFVESPDMKNIYDGNITTDETGQATVTLPEWFEALNRDFRYQLTVIGQFAQAIVSSKINGNRFTIRTSAPNVEVSWQVTGIRQDAWANAHRIPVEEGKSDKERGFYLHPELFNQPEEKNVEWARNPQVMREMKERREQLQNAGTKNH